MTRPVDAGVVKVLMVCMGNICRSPTAEAVLRVQAERRDLGARLFIDSAGTHGHYHAGEPPDPRSQKHAARRGYDLSPLRAREVLAQDFERFDWILAMDEANLDDLRQQCPDRFVGKLARLLDFAPGGGDLDVPDPYYGGAAGFETVLDRVEAGCTGWLDRVFGRS